MREANHRTDENTGPSQMLSSESDIVGLNGERGRAQPDRGVGELCDLLLCGIGTDDRMIEQLGEARAFHGGEAPSAEVALLRANELAPASAGQPQAPLGRLQDVVVFSSTAQQQST